MLRDITARLHGRSATDTITSNASTGSRGIVAVTLPVEGETVDPDAAPWVQQPSVLRHIRSIALQQRALIGASESDVTHSVPLPPAPPRPQIYRSGDTCGFASMPSLQPSAVHTTPPHLFFSCSPCQEHRLGNSGHRLGNGDGGNRRALWPAQQARHSPSIGLCHPVGRGCCTPEARAAKHATRR